MNFEKIMAHGSFHAYARMEHMNTNCQIVDSHNDIYFNINNYAFDFFNCLNGRNIYFNYFLLTKWFDLDDVMNSAFTTITSLSTPLLFLHNRKEIEIEIEINKTYRLCFESPSFRHKR